MNDITKVVQKHYKVLGMSVAHLNYHYNVAHAQYCPTLCSFLVLDKTLPCLVKI